MSSDRAEFDEPTDREIVKPLGKKSSLTTETEKKKSQFKQPSKTMAVDTGKSEKEAELEKLKDVMDSSQRHDKMHDQQQLAHKLLISDDGQMVQISRIILPETAFIREFRRSKKKMNSGTPKEPKTTDADTQQDEQLAVKVIHPTADGIKVTQVIFIDSNADLKDSDFLSDLQYRIVGNYLCYRRYSETRIKIRRVLLRENEADLVQMPTGEIDLKELLSTPYLMMFVTFSEVPPSSFLSQRVRIDGKADYHESLIQITVKNECYIFALEDYTEDRKLKVSHKEIDF